MQKQCTQQVSDQEILPMIAAHTDGDTSQATLRYLFVASVVSSSAFVFFTSDGWERPLCKEENKMTIEEQEKYTRSS